jgi:hypothetical protein
MKQNLKVIIVIVLMASVGKVFAADVPYSQLLNLTAKQRALSQRITKSWLCKNEGISLETSSKEILASTTTFEQALKVMNEKAPDANTKKANAKIEAQWAVFKKLIDDASNKNYQNTIVASNALLLACEEALKELISYIKSQKNISSGYDVQAVIGNIELCGRQRYLTQRFVIYYSLHFSGKAGTITANKSCQGILEELNENFNNLLLSDINTSDISDELSSITAEWKNNYEKLKAYNYEAIDKKKVTADEIFINMNKLFIMFDKTVTMYSNLLKN